MYLSHIWTSGFELNQFHTINKLIQIDSVSQKNWTV